jgi:hypothetical protein
VAGPWSGSSAWDPAPKPFFVGIRASEMTVRRLPLGSGGVTVERQRGDLD